MAEKEWGGHSLGLLDFFFFDKNIVVRNDLNTEFRSVAFGISLSTEKSWVSPREWAQLCQTINNLISRRQSVDVHSQ